jgi:hypothetical protein
MEGERTSSLPAVRCPAIENQQERMTFACAVTDMSTVSHDDRCEREREEGDDSQVSPPEDLTCNLLPLTVAVTQRGRTYG